MTNMEGISRAILTLKYNEKCCLFKSYLLPSNLDLILVKFGVVMFLIKMKLVTNQ